MKFKARRPKPAHPHLKAEAPEADRVDHVPAADPAAAANSFAARRCASSAPKRSTPSPTGMSVCCKGLWPSEARLCTTHQRRLTRAIKQARNIALLPFATHH